MLHGIQHINIIVDFNFIHNYARLSSFKGRVNSPKGTINNILSSLSVFLFLGFNNNTMQNFQEQNCIALIVVSHINKLATSLMSPYCMCRQLMAKCEGNLILNTLQHTYILIKHTAFCFVCMNKTLCDISR